MAKKILKIILIITVLLIVLAAVFVSRVPISQPKAFGTTFSSFYAELFGLDWQKAYTAIFEDLGIKKVRLPAYWNEIEKSENEYDFSRLDWQIKEAEKHNAEIILAVGLKLPRWTECHEPDWLLDKKKPKTAGVYKNDCQPL